MKKPWNEEWLHFMSGVLVPDEGWDTKLVALTAVSGSAETKRERAQLAAAAPDLYRALEAVEWVTVRDEAGNDMRDECPECEGISPEWAQGHGRWRGETGHREDCSLAAALRKARGEQ